jgi:hypothetical protein
MLNDSFVDPLKSLVCGLFDEVVWKNLALKLLRFVRFVLFFNHKYVLCVDVFVDDSLLFQIYQCVHCGLDKVDNLRLGKIFELRFS